MRTAAVLGMLVLLDGALATGAGLALNRAQPALQQAAGDSFTRDSYEARARARAGAPPTSPTFSAYLSPVGFTALEGGSNLSITAGRPVWVVTVHAFHHCEDCEFELPTAGNWVYSVVYDARSGQEVDYCAGCALLAASRYDSLQQRALTQAPDWFREAVEARLRLP